MGPEGKASVRYLEFVFEMRGIALRVDADHVVVRGFELAHGNRSLATQTRLQDGIVDENVLLLRARGKPRDVCQQCMHFYL